MLFWTIPSRVQIQMIQRYSDSYLHYNTLVLQLLLAVWNLCECFDSLWLLFGTLLKLPSEQNLKADFCKHFLNQIVSHSTNFKEWAVEFLCKFFASEYRNLSLAMKITLSSRNMSEISFRFPYPTSTIGISAFLFNVLTIDTSLGIASKDFLFVML